MNDRQTFFLLRGAWSCYIEKTILKYEQAAQRKAVAAEIPSVLFQKKLYTFCHSGLDPESSVFILDSCFRRNDNS